MSMASKTPRTTVKDYLQNVSTEVAQKVLRRRSEAKLPDAATSGELEQGSSSGKKQGLRGKATGQAVRRTPQMGGSIGKEGTEEMEATPRHIIQSMLTVQGTAQPVTRRKRRVSDAIMRPPVSTKNRRTVRHHSIISTGLDIDDVTKKFTPRTNILGFLEQAPEMTPAARQTSSIPDSHSTTQNVSSCFTVNEVGVTLLEGNSDAEVNVSARGGRFRNKKRNLNIQLPELSPQVLLHQVPLPDSASPTDTLQSGSKGDVDQDLDEPPPPPDSPPPSVQLAEEEGSTSTTITSRSAKKSTPGTIAVTEADKTTTNDGNADNADALNSPAEEGKNRTSERNVFSDVFGGSGDGVQIEAEENERLRRYSVEKEVEPFQGGNKGQTQSFSGHADSEERSSIQGSPTPRSGGVKSAMLSQTTFEAMWTTGKTPELTDEKAENERTDLSKSGQSMHALRRSIRNAENIVDATPASAGKRARSLMTPSIQNSPSSANRSKKQVPGNTSLSQAESLANSSRSQAFHSPNIPGSSKGGLQSSAQKGSSLKKQSGQKSLQLSGNLSMMEDGLGESPVPGVLSRNTPLTSTPRVPHQPPPLMPTPGTSSSHKSAALASSRGGRTPGSASNRGRGGSTGKNLQSSSQRQSRLSAVSRLSNRFDAMESTPASAQSGREEVPEKDTGDGQMTTDMLAETADNHQMPDLMEEQPDQEDSSSDESDEEYLPLKTPVLPPKANTPATEAPRSANRDKNNSRTGGAPRAGVKRKAVTAPRSAKKPSTGLPTSVIKTLFGHFCHLRVSKEAVAEVERLSEQYWANMAEDLEAYAAHAHRHTINDSDVELLMKRQGFITDSRSLNTLIAKYLPLEQRQELIPIARSGNVLQLK